MLEITENEARKFLDQRVMVMSKFKNFEATVVHVQDGWVVFVRNPNGKPNLGIEMIKVSNIHSIQRT